MRPLFSEARRVRRSYISVIIALGIGAMSGQIVLLREFLGSVCGNEFSIGAVFAAWLAGGAMGGMAGARYGARIKHKDAAIPIGLVVVSWMLIVWPAIIRAVPWALGLIPGETIAPFPMMVSAVIIVVPVSSCPAFLFACACSLKFAGDSDPAEDVGRAYLFETIGSAAGGLITSFVLVRYCNSFEALFIVGATLLTCGLSGARVIASPGLRRALTVLTAASLLVVAAGWCARVPATLDVVSRAVQWRGERVIASKDSPYGNICVTRRGDSISFFENGLRLFTVPDKQAAEEAVHYALLEHPSPRTVLLVGGGAGGALGEILRHPVEHVDYCEQDPALLDMARSLLPDRYRAALSDPRVTVHAADGRSFVRTAPAKYDTVILNVGDPVTISSHRYYSQDFYRDVARILNSGGILSFSVSASENVINRDCARGLRTIYATLRSVFKEGGAMQGERAVFFASDQAGRLTWDYNVLMDRAHERSIPLEYAREYFLFSQLSPERIGATREFYGTNKVGLVTTDMNPVLCRDWILFWAGAFRGSSAGNFLRAWTKTAVTGIFTAAAGIIIACGFFIRGRTRYRAGAHIALFAAGGVWMMAQFVIVIAFQSLFGYLYYEIGAILTMFMIGLSIGGCCGNLLIRNNYPCRRWLMVSLAAAAALLVLLPHCIMFVQYARISLRWGAALFLLISVCAGFIGGAQFPLIASIVSTESASPAVLGGSLYGIDLAGAAAAALFAGTAALPAIGVAGVLYGNAFIVAALLCMFGLMSRNRLGR